MRYVQINFIPTGDMAKVHGTLTKRCPSVETVGLSKPDEERTGDRPPSVRDGRHKKEHLLHALRVRPPAKGA